MAGFTPPQPKKIRGNMDAPAGAQLTGELVNGRPVYRIEKPVYENRIKTGPDGKELWNKHPTTGQPISPQVERVQVGTEVEEFVLVDLGNGIVKKNRNFRDESEELVRKDADDLKAKIAKLEETVAALAAGGLPDDVVDSLKDAATEELQEVAAEASQEEEPAEEPEQDEAPADDEEDPLDDGLGF